MLRTLHLFVIVVMIASVSITARCQGESCKDTFPEVGQRMSESIIQIDKQPALAAESPPPSATIVDSSLPEIIPFTDILAINNANLNNGGNSWSQQSGYDYASVYISNTSSQTLNVYLSYDLSGSKQNIGNYTVSANGTLTINVTHARGHVFYVDYNTANGVVSGKISVRSSDVPL